MSTITAKMVQTLREKTGLGMMDCKKALVESNGDMDLAIENLRKKGQATAEKRAGKSATEGRVAVVISGSTGVAYEVNCETDFVANSNDFVKFVEDLGQVLVAAKVETVEAALALTLNGMPVAEAMSEVIGKVGEKVQISNVKTLIADANEALYSYTHSNNKIAALVKMSSSQGILANEDVVTLGKDVAMHISANNPVAITKEGIPAAVVAKEIEIYVEQIKNEGKSAEMAEKIAQGKLGKFYKENVLLEQEFIKADKKPVADILKQHGDLAISAFASLFLGASQED